MLLPIIQQRSPSEKTHRTMKKQVDAVLIHRCHLGTKALDVINAFTGGVPEAARATGYKMPYHLVVEKDGTVVQALSLSYRGTHARSWNSHSIGVCMLGDFRRESPSCQQWLSAVMLVGLLSRPQGWKILGHDEAPGGSAFQNKRCPGHLWDMDEFREDVRNLAIESEDINDFWSTIRC